MIERDWHKCYGEGWQDMIVPDAFAHPAKFSRTLIRRIYQHAIEQGYFAIGDIVLDPFGGVALGALHAMHQGLQWYGVELEPRFVALGQQNVDLWNERFSALPRWSNARLVQGDSRRLCEMAVGEACGVVSSPPWEGCHNIVPVEANARQVTSERVQTEIRYGNADNQLGNESTATFWQASRDIMQQCYQILAPGAVAIWTLKSFVRNKRIVPFPEQWRQLGEACGFETLEWIRAWLVEDRGAQFDLLGELHEHRVERKSFFRRLAESKGSPRIDYEVVLIQRK